MTLCLSVVVTCTTVRCGHNVEQTKGRSEGGWMGRVDGRIEKDWDENKGPSQRRWEWRSLSWPSPGLVGC